MAGGDSGREVSRLGAYRLHGVLGEGGMGVVHLGVDESGRAVAVKVLRDHVAHDPVARARLAREVSTLRRVEHPAIAPFLGADTDGDRPYIVTRYIGGDPLDKWVAAHGPLQGEELRAFGTTLADALEAIHAAGVVHRDLKPGNVLMPGGSPVVIDFGIAQVADETRLTSTGLIMGTPGYVAPELLDGQEVSIATDLWGYAATLAFAATGRPPFGLGHSSSVLDRVHRGATDLGGLAPWLADLLQRALDPDPTRRPTLAVLRSALADPSRDLTPPPAAPSAPAESSMPPRPDMAPAPGGYKESLGPDPRGAGPRTQILPAVTEPVRRPVTGAAAPPPSPRREDIATAAHPIISTRVMPAVPTHTARPQPQPQPQPTGDPSYASFAPRPQSQAPQFQAQQPRYEAPPGSGAPMQHGMGMAPAPGGHLQGYPQPGQPVAPAPGYAPIPRRVGTMFALGLVMVALITYAPGIGLLAALGWSWLARFVDRLITAVALRRAARGGRDRDMPLAVLGSPLHLIGSAISAVVAGVLPLLVGLGFGVGLRAMAGSVAGVPVGTASVVGISAAAALVVAWWGPGGTTLRRGSRSVARAVSPGRHGGQVAVGMLLLAAAALGVLTQSSGWSLSWWPLDEWWQMLPYVGAFALT